MRIKKMIDSILNDVISVGIAIFLLMIFYNMIAPFLGLPHLTITDLIEIFKKA